MLGKTHRAGGTLFAIAGFEMMRQNGMLLEDVNPLLELAIIYPVAQWASTLPDLDHHWDSVGSKTPVNWLVHRALHLTRPKHRSWQTHSLLVSGGFLWLLWTLVTLGNNFMDETEVSWVIARILVTGFILGYSSHLFLDSINPSGIHVIPGVKMRLVPRTKFFATGGPWESRIIYPLCLGVSSIFLFNFIMSYFDTSVWGLAVSIMTR